MKIAWFTPLSTKSAIGRANASIVRELAKLADLEVWHSEGGPKHAVEAKTTYFRGVEDPILKRLAEFDLIFYNFGNHLPYHRDIYLTAGRYPGVIILHDFVMHHFFASYYLEELHDPGLYLEEMERLYGAKGLAAARKSLRGAPVWETGEVVEFPMFEGILRGALGVVTHSDFLLEKAGKRRTGPIRKIPLPYEIPAVAVQAKRENLGVEAGRLIVLTVGHVNSNKRIDAAIEAIGTDRTLSARLHLVIAGPCDPRYRQRLEAIIRKHKLSHCVEFRGYVSDEDLQALLTHADICINLRYPSIEGASASVIEEMLYGKPVVVSDTGFYAELPSDAVMKVRLQQEQADLRAALVELLDVERRAGLGGRARAYAAETFRADRYAKDIVSFAWHVRGARPVFGLADRVASELRQMNVSADMALVDTVSAICAGLFFGHEDV